MFVIKGVEGFIRRNKLIYHLHDRVLALFSTCFTLTRINAVRELRIEIFQERNSNVNAISFKWIEVETSLPGRRVGGILTAEVDVEIFGQCTNTVNLLIFTSIFNFSDFLSAFCRFCVDFAHWTGRLVAKAPPGTSRTGQLVTNRSCFSLEYNP